MPETIGQEKAIRNMLEAGEWKIQRSPSADKFVYYPREATPGTGKRDLEWVEPSGMGTVYSFTIVNRREEQGGPYNVVIVELDEGPRMMSTLKGVSPEDVKIGQRVKARVEDAAVVFDLAEG